MSDYLPPERLLLLFMIFITCRAEVNMWTRDIARGRANPEGMLPFFVTISAPILTVASLGFWVALLLGGGWRVALTTAAIAIILSIFYELVIRTLLFPLRHIMTFFLSLAATPVAVLLVMEVRKVYFV